MRQVAASTVRHSDKSLIISKVIINIFRLFSSLYLGLCILTPKRSNMFLEILTSFINLILIYPLQILLLLILLALGIFELYHFFKIRRF